MEKVELIESYSQTWCGSTGIVDVLKKTHDDLESAWRGSYCNHTVGSHFIKAASSHGYGFNPSIVPSRFHKSDSDLGQGFEAAWDQAWAAC